MSQDKDENKPKEIKVEDKRRFDSSGNERKDVKVSSTSSVNEAKSSTVEKKAVKQDEFVADKPLRAKAPESLPKHEEKDQEEPEFEIDFTSFVMSLATQAMMQLGAMQAPNGVTMPVDREAARQTIEILAMLSHKTRGNLDASEQQMIQDILHNLRIGFVKTANAG